MRDLEHVAADVVPAHARGISRADQRADRGPGNGRRLDAHVVERLDHRDMGEPARAAGAERQCEGFHAISPAATAKLHAFAASGPTISALAAA